MKNRIKSLPPLDPSEMEFQIGGTEEEVRAKYGLNGHPDLEPLVVELVGWEKGKRETLPLWRIRPRRAGETSRRSPGELKGVTHE